MKLMHWFYCLGYILKHPKKTKMKKSMKKSTFFNDFIKYTRDNSYNWSNINGRKTR